MDLLVDCTTVLFTSTFENIGPEDNHGLGLAASVLQYWWRPLRWHGHKSKEKKQKVDNSTSILSFCPAEELCCLISHRWPGMMALTPNTSEERRSSGVVSILQARPNRHLILKHPSLWYFEAKTWYQKPNNSPVASNWLSSTTLTWTESHPRLAPYLKAPSVSAHALDFPHACLTEGFSFHPQWNTDLWTFQNGRLSTD